MPAVQIIGHSFLSINGAYNLFLIKQAGRPDVTPGALFVRLDIRLDIRLGIRSYQRPKRHLYIFHQ